MMMGAPGEWMQLFPGDKSSQSGGGQRPLGPRDEMAMTNARNPSRIRSKTHFYSCVHTHAYTCCANTFIHMLTLSAYVHTHNCSLGVLM